MFVGITIAVWAFLKPIEGDLLSLIIVFFLNFFFRLCIHSEQSPNFIHYCS